MRIWIELEIVSSSENWAKIEINMHETTPILRENPKIGKEPREIFHYIFRVQLQRIKLTSSVSSGSSR